MSNEISLTASLSAFKQGAMLAAIGRSITSRTFDMTGMFYTEGTISVGTTATQIPLGQVSQPHWCFFLNQDLVSQLYIRNGAGGTDFLFFRPQEGFPCAVAGSVTLYAIATPQPALLEYLIISL